VEFSPLHVSGDYRARRDTCAARVHRGRLPHPLGCRRAFQALKTGCQFEWRQLESFSSIENGLAIFPPIAVRLLALRGEARARPSGICKALTKQQISILRRHTTRFMSPRPNNEQAAQMRWTGQHAQSCEETTRTFSNLDHFAWWDCNLSGRLTTKKLATVTAPRPARSTRPAPAEATQRCGRTHR